MKTTDFFSHIAALDFTGGLQMVLKKDGDALIVSLLLTNEQCADKAKALIPPLVLKGTAQELDSGFFNQVTAPIETTSGLLTNMEDYLKAQEAAKLQSRMEKDKENKERKEGDAKDKKLNDALQQAAQLEKEGKYKEAWAKLPDPSKYPERAEELRKKRKELSDKFTPPDLFGSAVAEELDIPEGEAVEIEEDEKEEDNQNED